MELSNKQSMKLDEKIKTTMFKFVDFLKERKLTIPDKDVAPVFKLKYEMKLNVAEYSSLLSLLESQNLLNKEKSVNKDQNFYTNKHKLFIDYTDGKLKI
jgi:hypothetical protein